MARKLENFIPPIIEDGIVSDKGLNVLASTVNTSGGATAAGVLMGSSSFGIYFGTGTPTFSATQGSLYLNIAGSSTSTRLYVNGGTTTWIAVTTAS